MKRSRHTVTYSPHGSSEVKREVVLCYEASSARSHFERRGTVLEVRKGDYRTEARKAEQRRIQRPTGARPNYLAIRQQVENLGLRLPVQVKVTGHHGRRLGVHKFDGDTHQILVKNWLDRERMGQTIHHELEHAAQAERVAHNLRGRAAALAWHRAYRDGTSYRHKRWERDARAAEARNAGNPLAR